MANESNRKIKLRDIPWGTIGTGIAATGASVGTGLFLGNLTGHALTHHPLAKKYLEHLTPEQRVVWAQRAGGAAGALGGLAYTGHRAAQAERRRRAYDRMQKDIEDRSKKEEGTKTASVCSAYLAAMDVMDE